MRRPHLFAGRFELLLDVAHKQRLSRARSVLSTRVKSRTIERFHVSPYFFFASGHEVPGNGVSSRSLFATLRPFEESNSGQVGRSAEARVSFPCSREFSHRSSTYPGGTMISRRIVVVSDE